MYRQALEMRTSCLGDCHPEVAVTAHNLGVCLSQQGKHDDALAAHQQALWVRQQLLEEQQALSDGQGASALGGGVGVSAVVPSCLEAGVAADVVASHRSVALCLTRLGRHEEAEEQLQQVLDAVRAAAAELDPPAPAPLDPTRLQEIVKGGKGCGRNRGSARAGGLGDGCLTAGQRQALVATAVAAEELGRCYSQQGKHAAAEEVLWEALEAREQVLGGEDEGVGRLEEALRRCLAAQCQ
jgi:tetratricopeptide (TPR) repeat protein